MSLPGKLCIGILEEDNPQKAYFRFKPLLVEAEGRYVPYTETNAYPEEGCIRIVPDKNESARFKTRMRQMGLFCVVDLRAHPDHNDKIRPNKNFREGSTEQNAFILYSDVIREPAPDSIFEILPEAQPETPRPHPRTAAVLLKGAELDLRRFEWEADPQDDSTARLIDTGKHFAPDALQTFDLAGFKGEPLSFAITAPDGPKPVTRPMDKPVPADKPRPEERHDAPQPAEPRPPRPENPAMVRPDDAEKPAPADKPRPEERRNAPQPAEARPPCPEKPAKARPDDPEKPWIHHDKAMLPGPVDPRLSPSQRSLAAQSGMNPRRGRSLQELIDEKWQQSRLGQLGQPVAPIHTDKPLVSPVESAVEAVRDVWNQPQLRQDLLQSLGGIEEFGASLEECREAVKQSDIERHLENLEARRLALLGELDHLTLKNAETRESLKQELRGSASGELADALNRAKAARAEQAKYEKLAQEARAAAQDARKVVDDLTGEELERRLADFALNQRMVERLALLRGEAEPVPVAPVFEKATLAALADRVENRFAAEGFAISREAALNLCACAAVGPALILTGPVGSGKTAAFRLLADALGFPADRAVAIAPGKGSLEADSRIEALNRFPDVPALILLDDANLHASSDPLRGLGELDRPLWRLCLTVQDAAHPLRAHTLDRGFTLRLETPANAPWRPQSRTAWTPQSPLSLDIDTPDGPLPAACEDRMQALREALAQCDAAPSRRALDAAWRYCALMLDALPDADPVHILDLAVSQRLLPPLLASAPIAALRQLPGLLEGLPLSRALLRHPLPIQL